MILGHSPHTLIWFIRTTHTQVNMYNVHMQTSNLHRFCEETISIKLYLIPINYFLASIKIPFSDFSTIFQLKWLNQEIQLKIIARRIHLSRLEVFVSVTYISLFVYVFCLYFHFYFFQALCSSVHYLSKNGSYTYFNIFIH